MSEELKTCPFCGSDLVGHSKTQESVTCALCGARGPIPPHEAFQWNRRAPSPELLAAQGEAERMREALELGDRLASWAMCAREDRRIRGDVGDFGEPMVAQTLKWTTELLRLADAQRDASAALTRPDLKEKK